MTAITTLRDAVRPVERPPFEVALEFFEEMLAQRLLAAPIRWLFRENVTLGEDGGGDPAATLCFQRTDPAVGECEARDVYSLLAEWEPELRLTPLVATPNELFVTICTGTHADLTAVYRGEWGLWFDVQPVFHTFHEITSEDTWRRATRPPDDPAELEDIALGAREPLAPRSRRAAGR